MATIVQPPFYVPRPSDDFVWSPVPESLNSAVLQALTQTAKPKTKQWNYDYQEPSPWVPTPENLNSGIIPVLAGKPTSLPRQWLFGYDDAGFWQGSPISSKLL